MLTTFQKRIWRALLNGVSYRELARRLGIKQHDLHPVGVFYGDYLTDADYVWLLQRGCRQKNPPERVLLWRETLRHARGAARARRKKKMIVASAFKGLKTGKITMTYPIGSTPYNENR